MVVASTGPAMNVLLVVPWDERFGGVVSVVGNLARSLERSGHRVVFFHPGQPRALPAPDDSVGLHGLRAESPLTLHREGSDQEPPRLPRLPRAHAVSACRGDPATPDPDRQRSLSGEVVRVLRTPVLAPADQARRLGPRRGPLSRRTASGPVPVVRPAARGRRGRAGGPVEGVPAGVPGSVSTGSPEGKVVHNGVDMEELGSPDPEELMPAQPPYVLCIAAHNEKKALDVLLTAFAEIGDAHRGVRLLLVETVPSVRSTRPRRSPGAGSARGIPGERGRAEVARLLHRCSIFVLPSRSEPFGMVVPRRWHAARP